MSTIELCPCRSKKPFNECCHPFLQGLTYPESPEQLMRSRFSAFATKNYEYVAKTNLGQEADLANVEAVVKSMTEDYLHIHWLNLKVIESGETDADAGFVSFNAFYGYKGKIFVLKEYSHFKKQEGRWFYDAETSDSEVERMKISKNDLCICGSGKKFKKCCERKLV